MVYGYSIVTSPLHYLSVHVRYYSNDSFNLETLYLRTQFIASYLTYCINLAIYYRSIRLSNHLSLIYLLPKYSTIEVSIVEPSIFDMSRAPSPRCTRFALQLCSSPPAPSRGSRSQSEHGSGRTSPVEFDEKHAPTVLSNKKTNSLGKTFPSAPVAVRYPCRISNTLSLHSVRLFAGTKFLSTSYPFRDKLRISRQLSTITTRHLPNK